MGPTSRGAYYAPEAFDSSVTWTEGFEGDRVPDIDAARHDYDLVGFDVEPGDALIFSAWTIHGAPGNAGPNRRAAFSTRWLGDDARWAPHPGSDPTVDPDDVPLEPGTYQARAWIVAAEASDLVVSWDTQVD